VSPDGPEAHGDDRDADPGDGRDETVSQRMDRNWIELLQELRVTQTGTQILTGFLLAVAFQQRFDELTDGQRHLYLGLIVTAVLTTALALAPVSLHRALFRRHAKARLVAVSNVLLRAVLLGVALVLGGTVVLIFDVVVGFRAAAVAGVLSVLVLAALTCLPLLVRTEARRT
jgi:O-antigen/teichoic acid export membrane protein